MNIRLPVLCCLVLLRGTIAAATPLGDAINAGDTRAALALIDSDGANLADPDGTTPLHWAVYRDNVEVVKALLAARARVDAANDYGSTPLSEAAVVGNITVLDLLLKAGAEVDSPNADGQTALMIVARTSNVAAARLLLRRGAKVNASEAWQGQTPLMWAAAQSQPAMVAELVKHKADVDARSRIFGWERQVTSEPRYQVRPVGGLTPLLYAARQGCLECTRILVEAGADMNLPDPQGVTPLIMATSNFSFDVATYLLGAGADPNRWDWWGRTPLYLAVDLNTIPQGGRSDRPSLDATTSLELIEMLLEAGANPNAQLKLFPPYRHVQRDRGFDQMLTIGATPLLRAAKAGDTPAVRLLLEYKAHPDLPNVQGTTPLMAAAGLGSGAGDTRGRFITADSAAETLQILIAAGAEVNARNQRGQAAVHGAAQWGWDAAIDVLAKHGAVLDAKDDAGRTPADFALGKAGAQGRGSQAVVRAETAALLERFLAEKTGKTAPGLESWQ